MWAIESYYDLESSRNEIAMSTERLFKGVWDLKPVGVHFGSHVTCSNITYAEEQNPAMLFVVKSTI